MTSDERLGTIYGSKPHCRGLSLAHGRGNEDRKRRNFWSGSGLVVLIEHISCKVQPSLFSTASLYLKAFKNIGSVRRDAVRCHPFLQTYDVTLGFITPALVLSKSWKNVCVEPQALSLPIESLD